MKNNIFLSLAGLIIFTFNICAQDAQYECGDEINCPGKHPFRFCDSLGNIETFCAYDPYDFSETLFDSEYKYPLKMNAIPLCLAFDGSGPDKIGVSCCDNFECQTALIYNKTDFENDMEKAEYEWNCICGFQDDACRCTVTVGFSEEQIHFIDPYNDPASNSLDRNPELIENCTISCNDLHIYLNYTDFFTYKHRQYEGPDYVYYPKQGSFFVSGSIADNWELDGWTPHAYNLESVIKCQMGKLLGLDWYGVNERCYNTTEGVLYNAMNSNSQTDRNGAAWPLSDDEKCMFAKLYCSELPVEEEVNKESDNKDYNYPNPFDTKTKIRFFVGPNLGARVKIRIFDNLGNTVSLLTDKYYEHGTNEVIFDSENLISGLYYYTIEINGEISFNSMQVIK